MFTLKKVSLFCVIAYLFVNGILAQGPSEIRLIKKADIASEANINQLKAEINGPSSILFEGTEKELMSNLGLPYYSEEDTGDRSCMFARYAASDGRIWMASFVMAKSFSESRKINLESQTMEIEFPKQEIAVNIDESLLLVQRAQNWFAKVEMESTIVLKNTQYGEWKAFESYDFERIGCDEEGKHVIITLTLTPYKIRDLSGEKDWYVVQSQLHHEINIDKPYEENFTLVGKGRVGWYMEDRELKLQTGRDDIKLLSYGPTGTINNGSQSLDLGAGLSGDVSTDGPGVGLGIDVGYNKTWSYTDITMTDQSSLSSGMAYWKEAFVCPRGNYMWWPIVDWPANNSKNSFYSEPAAVYNTTNITNGVKLNVDCNCVAAEDLITGYVVAATVQHNWFELNISASLSFFKNYAPETPTIPSGNISHWVNELYTYQTSAVDVDCNEMEYNFDWGDGLYTLGGNDQSHQWSEGGDYGVRVQAIDQPFESESLWSLPLEVHIKSIVSIEINGQDNVEGNSCSLYQCTAYYNFNEGNASTVLPEWSVMSGEDYASITYGGILTVEDVESDQVIILQADYEDHGVKKTAYKQVTIDKVSAIEERDVMRTFHLYPNPCMNKLMIAFDDLVVKDHHIYIYSVSGELVFKYSIASNKSECELDVSCLNSGIYIVIFNGHHLKFVKN